MVKCFLSHSSKDKQGYVQIVYDKLGSELCIYDERTFEAGMQSLEEILRNLQKTDLFVLFLSDNSLNSEWVRTEIREAKGILDQGSLNRIYPIITDKTLYTDERIPEWMRSEYNLQQIPRPIKASVLIKRQLREITWQYYPKLRERQKIFVGRHDIVRAFEERINDFEKPTPVCIIASGIPEMGRRTVLKQCCMRTSIFEEKYDPVSITLNREQSIEDFIRGIYDLGFSSHRSFGALIEKSINEKVIIAIELIKEIQQQNEKILIVDNDCLISQEGEISIWFLNILDKIKQQNKVTFLIASRFQFYRRKQKLYEEDSIYEINVPELSHKEREGLLKRYTEFKELSLDTANYQEFSQLLTGFPPQVFHLVDLIKREGIHGAKRLKEEIRDYSRKRAKVLLENLNEEELDFLRLIGEFDSASYELLFKVVDESKFLPIIEMFLGASICEQIGNSGEYIRVNDAVKDHISRIKYSLDLSYEKKLRSLLAEFLETYQSEEKDSSDYFYFLKQALKKGSQIAKSDLIPSHFLRAMRDLYNQEENRYKEVVDLAIKALKNEFALDNKIRDEIRSLFLRSMARLARTEKKYQDDFLREMSTIQTEIDKISDYRHKHNALFQQHFLFGFYYRLQGRSDEALQRLDKSLSIKPTSAPARQEKVNVLVDIGAYEDALSLARANYDDQPTNPYHAAAYFRCLIFNTNNPPIEDVYGQLNSILRNIEGVNSRKAKEVFANLSVLMKTFYEQDESSALRLVNEAIEEFPYSDYLQITKCDTLLHFDNLSELSKVLSKLEKNIDKSSSSYQSLIQIKSKLLARQGRLLEAITMVEQKLAKYPKVYLDRIKIKLKRLADESNS